MYKQITSYVKFDVLCRILAGFNPKDYYCPQIRKKVKRYKKSTRRIYYAIFCKVKSDKS